MPFLSRVMSRLHSRVKMKLGVLILLVKKFAEEVSAVVYSETSMQKEVKVG